MEMDEICERLKAIFDKALEKGYFKTLENVENAINLYFNIKSLNFTSREEFDQIISYFYQIAEYLHNSGYLSFGESHFMYDTFIKIENTQINFELKEDENYRYEDYNPVSKDGEVAVEELLGQTPPDVVDTPLGKKRRIKKEKKAEA